MTLFSVIIATYNREHLLKDALQSLLNQKRDGSFDWEIIVVDNRSTDGTRETVERFAAQDPGKIKYSFEPRQGKSYALNKGISEAHGEIIAFTDDDAIADPSWLSSLNECFQRFSCDGVGGRVLPVYPEGTKQWIKDNAVQLAGAVVIYEYGDAIKPLDKTMFPFIGCNYAFRRQIFDTYGLFREDLGPGTPTISEDTEFVERLFSQGKQLYYCGKALVRHPYDPKRLRWGKLAKWHMAIGHYAAEREIRDGERFVYLLGVPRYLLKGLIRDLLRLGMNCFDRLGRWNAWRSFFRKVGMIQYYRSSRTKVKES